MRLAGVCSLPRNLSVGVISSYRDLDNISGMQFVILVDGQTFAALVCFSNDNNFGALVCAAHRLRMRRGNSPQLVTQAIKFGPKFNLLDSAIF